MPLELKSCLACLGITKIIIIHQRTVILILFMGDRFEERFKGKTTKLDKQGLDGLAQKAGQPISKGPVQVANRTGGEMAKGTRSLIC